jgi:hypothetical protein
MHVNLLCACWHLEAMKGLSSLTSCRLLILSRLSSSLIWAQLTLLVPTWGTRSPSFQDGTPIHRVRAHSLTEIRNKNRAPSTIEPEHEIQTKMAETGQLKQDAYDDEQDSQDMGTREGQPKQDRTKRQDGTARIGQCSQEVQPEKDKITDLYTSLYHSIFLSLSIRKCRMIIPDQVISLLKKGVLR